MLLVRERDDGGDAGLLDEGNGDTRLLYGMESLHDEEIDAGRYLLADAAIEKGSYLAAVGGAELWAALAEIGAQGARHVAVGSGGLPRQRHGGAVQLRFLLNPAHAPRHGLQHLGARPGELAVQLQDPVRVLQHGQRYAILVTAQAAALEFQEVAAVTEYGPTSQAFQEILWQGNPFRSCCVSTSLSVLAPRQKDQPAACLSPYPLLWAGAACELTRPQRRSRSPSRTCPGIIE